MEKRVFTPLIRLDKYISAQTVYSRSDSRKMIAKGLVNVNGSVVRQVDFKVNDQCDMVVLNGKTLTYEHFVYFIMNKPSGVLSASNDKTRQTVVDLLPPICASRNIFPVGRLDKDTTGLLLLTDDGSFAHRVISPRSGIEKSYVAWLDGEVTGEMITAFAHGVNLADGTVCAPAKLEALPYMSARIIITEGKYHQIKRMFGTVGLGVNRLHRERIGRLFLPDDLQPGEFKPVGAEWLEKRLLQNNPYTL